MKELRKKTIQIGGLFTFVIAFGTIGYMVIERWTLLDSLYMTTITLTTVGYKEVRELSFYGRVFTIFLVLGRGWMKGFFLI